MTKENSVAVIYHCDRLSEKVIRNRQKLQRRLQRAIEDMVEDGFTNFILPLDERSPFPTTFIDAIIAEKIHNSNIRLTIMLPYEGEQAQNYTEYADEIIYNHDNPLSLVDKLLATTSASVIYYERNCSQLHQITHHAQRNRLPLININL